MSHNINLTNDIEARKKIISDINTNFFVEAGAGSGKTSMLVNRMVAMVESGIPIEKICAITFTKAAAGEFYERFQKMLIKRSSPDCKMEKKVLPGQLPPPTEETRHRCEEALQKIDLCFMGTIDAFCGMVLSEHPSEAGIPSESGIVEKNEAMTLYKQYFVRICRGEYGEESAKEAKTFCSLHKNAEEVFVKGISLLMGNRSAHFKFDRCESDNLYEVYFAEWDEITAAVKCLKEHPELKYDANGKSRYAWDKINEIYKNISKPENFRYLKISKALKDLKDIRLIPEAMNHYEALLSVYFQLKGKNKKKWLECNIGEEGGILQRVEEFRYSKSLDFLEKCVKFIEKEMRQSGKLGYFDYLYYLREMLRKDAGEGGRLINHIYNRHSFFLIDEFQDTNPLQAEIFFYLASEKPHAKWSDCIPRPGSIFIVGDPKQSIYRFRSADVGSFLRVKNLFKSKAGEVLSLSANFRSKKILCEYYNRVFKKIMPEETLNSSAFNEIPLPQEKKEEFGGIFTYTAYSDKFENDYPDMINRVRVAEIIRRLVGNEKYLIRTGEDKNLRKIKYSDIMIITVDKNELKPLMNHLSSLGMPVRVEGAVLFEANEGLREISKIYSAAADESDTVSLYGALTGRLTGLSKEDIIIFKQDGGKLNLKFTFKEGAKPRAASLLVEEKLAKLNALSIRKRALSPAAFFSEIMDSYRIYENVNAKDLEIVYYALELIRGGEHRGEIASIKDGADFISRLLSGESEQERCLSLKENNESLHLANLHKVKGLEAPIVILSYEKEFKKYADMRIVHGEEEVEAYLFNLSKHGIIIETFFKTLKFTKEKDDETAAIEAEHKRLLYVAATRARNALIICDGIASITKDGENHISAWEALFENDLPDFFESIHEPCEVKQIIQKEKDASKLYDEAAEMCVFNNRSAEEPTYTVENPSLLKSEPENQDGQQKHNTKQDKEPIVSETDREKKGNSKILKEFPDLLGTMVHKLMETLVTSKLKAKPEEAAEGIIREYKSPETAEYEAEFGKILTSVANQMIKGGFRQSNGIQEDIIKTLLEADEVYCEVPFCYIKECDGEDKENKASNKEIIRNGIMDVIYRKGDKWRIVDYKTNADGRNLDERYKEQLKAYEKAFKTITGEEAEALTYHIDLTGVNY